MCGNGLAYCIQCSMSLFDSVINFPLRNETKEKSFGLSEQTTAVCMHCNKHSQTTLNFHILKENLFLQSSRIS